MRMYEFPKIYLNGKWQDSSANTMIDVFDSSNGARFGTIVSATGDDVHHAAEAARSALGDWSALDPSERAAFARRIGTGIESRSAELAEVITRETGMPRWLSERIQVQLPITSFELAADIAETFEYETTLGNSRLMRVPVGVVGCITPWNYPLHQICAKVAYALTAGCTIVLKPSEIAPLDAFLLTEIIHDAGLPPGVFNLVPGTGPVVGEAISAHPDIDMVSFTGSTSAGKKVAATASGTLKRVALELGGKSANILLPDLSDEQFEVAVRDGVGKCYLNAGQTCTALTRMLVPRDRLSSAEAHAADEVTAKFVPQDPFAERAKMGPLASAAQVQRVTEYVQVGLDEGAKLLVGGTDRPPDVDPDGYFVQPTVFSDVRNDMRIAREEIFGPVLSILPYDDVEEAISIANDSPYGLSGGVHGADADQAFAVARRLRTGQVEVNRGAFNPSAPFGGRGQSGYGREYGPIGFEEFLEVVSYQL